MVPAVWCISCTVLFIFEIIGLFPFANAFSSGWCVSACSSVSILFSEIFAISFSSALFKSLLF
jgi:hypothetical protein